MKKKLILKLIESNDKAILGDIVQGLDGQKPIILEYLPTNMLPHKVIKPIAISDEKIKASCIFLNLENNQVVKLTKENEFGFVFRDSFKKIELLPEHFSPTIKQAIVDGKLKDGDSIEVEYTWSYSEVAKFEMGLLSDAYAPYPEVVPEKWKCYIPKLDSNNHAIIDIPESFKESLEKALHLECKSVDDVLTKMYAKAHIKLEHRPSSNDSNYNYIHQVDVHSLIEETVSNVSELYESKESIMYSEEECKEMVDEIVRYILHYKFSRNQVPALLVDKWFEENKKK